MPHGDAHGVVAAGDGLAGQAVSLGTQHDGQPLLRRQGRVLQAHRLFAQGHGRRFEAQGPQPCHTLLRPVCGGLPDAGPGHLEHRPHAHPHRPAVQRVAAGGGHQHRVHIQRRRRAKECAHVGWVRDSLQYGHPAGAGAQVLHRGQGGPLHGTQHAPGQGKAGEPGQKAVVGRIHRQVAAPGDQFPGLPPDVVPLGKQGHRDEARVQGAADDLWAFGNEQAPLRLGAPAELALGEPCEHVQLRGAEVGDLDDVGHGGASSKQLLQELYPLWGGPVKQRGFSVDFLPLRRYNIS